MARTDDVQDAREWRKFFKSGKVGNSTSVWKDITLCKRVEEGEPRDQVLNSLLFDYAPINGDRWEIPDYVDDKMLNPLRERGGKHLGKRVFDVSDVDFSTLLIVANDIIQPNKKMCWNIWQRMEVPEKHRPKVPGKNKEPQKPYYVYMDSVPGNIYVEVHGKGFLGESYWDADKQAYLDIGYVVQLKAHHESGYPAPDPADLGDVLDKTVHKETDIPQNPVSALAVLRDNRAYDESKPQETSELTPQRRKTPPHPTFAAPSDPAPTPARQTEESSKTSKEKAVTGKRSGPTRDAQQEEQPDLFSGPGF